MKILIQNKTACVEMSLKMRITLFLAIVSLFHIEAKTFSQNPTLSIDHDKIEIGVLFEEIEQKTEMTFLYNVEDIDLKHKVSIHANNRPISDILTKVLEGTKLTFDIKEDQIVIYPISDSKTKKVNDSTPYTNQSQQKRTIKGTVTDEDDMPLPNVNVILKDTINDKTQGTTTDFDGNFTLKFEGSYQILTFSMVGYQNREIPVNNISDEINIKMKQEVGTLDAAVVSTGYQKISKERATGAYETLEKNSLINLLPV